MELIQNSYRNFSDNQKRERQNKLYNISGGTREIVPTSELEGSGVYFPSGKVPDYSVAETERAVRSRDPNSEESRNASIAQQNKMKEDEYKSKLQLERNKSARPWLFGGK
jgi:hypothetical protein